MPIKTFLFAAVVFSVSFLSCSKERPNELQPPVIDAATLIMAKWSLLKDSVYNDGNFYFSEGGRNYYPSPGVYLGVAGDYYDFQPGGNLLITESTQNFSSSYKIFPNSKLVVDGLLVYDTASIVALTSTNAIFDWKATSSNGGKYYKRVYLKK